MNKSDERIYHIERKVDEILRILNEKYPNRIRPSLPPRIDPPVSTQDMYFPGSTEVKVDLMSAPVQ